MQKELLTLVKESYRDAMEPKIKSGVITPNGANNIFKDIINLCTKQLSIGKSVSVTRQIRNQFSGRIEHIVCGRNEDVLNPNIRVRFNDPDDIDFSIYNYTITEREDAGFIYRLIGEKEIIQETADNEPDQTKTTHSIEVLVPLPSA